MRIQTGQGRRGGRAAGTLFFGIFLAAGLVFTAIVAWQGWLQWQTRQWHATPARIVESRHVIDDGLETPYRSHVAYTYEAAGAMRRAEGVGLAPDWTDDFRDVQRLLLAYPVGAEVTAYVDPHEPDRSVLVREGPWVLAFAALPLLFVAVGAIGLVAMWRHRPSAAVSERAITGAAAGRSLGRAGLGLFFGLFAVIGGVLTWFLGVGPLMDAWQARCWPATPAVVERSTLLENSDSDGTTYRLDILYRYDIGGQTYRSNAYDTFSGSSSGTRGKRAILEHYPVGGETVCYVDPTDPTRAVLQPRPSPFLLLGLIPLVFLLVGVGGLLAMARGRLGRGRTDPPAIFPAAVRHDVDMRPAADADAVTLTSRGGRRTKCIVLSIVAVVWTGFSGAMWVMLYRDGEWVGVAFLTLFVLVGVGLGVAAAHQFLALFNPHVRLTLPPGPLRLGERIPIEWELTGSVARLQDFALHLEAQERATYRRGTDTHTDTHTFLTLTPLHLTDRARILDGRGRAEIALPAGTMHSFKARHNEIRWTLKATGAVHRWPDVCDDWEIDVRPARPRTVDAAATERAEAAEGGEA